jgi:ascorbate-specific PTS system EIIC-type component UlaA
MLTFVQWIANNIFGVPAFLIGLIVLLGLLLQKASASKLVAGTLKTILGFLIINIGSGVIVGALNIFQPMWAEIFGLSSNSMPTNFMGFDAFNGKFGGYVAMIMSLGFLVNVLVARFTKFKFIYLTGHMMFWTTAIFLGVILHVKPEASMSIVVPVLAIIMGLYWTLQPALTQKYMKKITNTDQVDRDIVAFARDKDEAVVQTFFIRAGKLIGRDHFHLSGVQDEEDTGIMASFIKQFYAGTPYIPKEIFLGSRTEEEELLLNGFLQNGDRRCT